MSTILMHAVVSLSVVTILATTYVASFSKASGVSSMDLRPRVLEYPPHSKLSLIYIAIILLYYDYNV